MSITLNKIKMQAPIKMHITLTSPMVPGIFPFAIATISTASPFLRRLKGVAEDTPSTVKFVMMEENEISKKHLAPRAGFIKFWPRPPNNIFTTTIAKKAPTTPIHQGADTGKLRAKRSPVTIAEKSPRVFLRLVIRLNKNSKKQAQKTVTAINKSAFNPNLYMPNPVAGSKATITQNIMLEVVTLDLI